MVPHWRQPNGKKRAYEKAWQHCLWLFSVSTAADRVIDLMI